MKSLSIKTNPNVSLICFLEQIYAQKVLYLNDLILVQTFGDQIYQLKICELIKL